MATQTTNPLVTHMSDHPAFKLWSTLTQPAEGVVGEDRRKASSLAALTLVFIPLAFFTVFLQPIMDMIGGNGFTAPNIGGLVGIAIVTLAYGLSRSRYHQFGGYLVISVPVIAVMFSGFGSATGISHLALFYMNLSVILSSLLLSSRETLITGVIVALILIFLSAFGATSAEASPSSILTFAVVATGVMSLVSRIREQSLEALELAQNQLVRQIAESEAARERAERSDQVKSAFLASMSHELRTPLNAIINFTRFVVKGTLGPVTEEQVETLDNVIISGKHLLNLINDVLDMAKIESGSLTLFISDDVSISDMLSEVAITGRALLNEKPVELKTEADPNLPTIRGDHQRMRQILLNILSNACKFTEEGSITISAKQDGDDVLISVVDTGRGIKLEDQAMVFEAFKQTDAGLRQGGGTGLGMPITKSLVEAHGGHISLESEEGKGATFLVRIPIRSADLTPTLITEV